MSGARLEALGQVRNVFPYLVNTGKFITVTVPVATFIAETKISVDGAYLPYDRGPDKSGRVYAVINGVVVAVSADAGATSVISGALYYRGNDANKIYLAAFQQTIASAFAVNNSSGTYLIPQPIVADSVDNIGYLGFENIASAAGTATNLILKVFVNIGFYGDYSEPKWGELFDKISNHDHIGLPNYDTVID